MALETSLSNFTHSAYALLLEQLLQKGYKFKSFLEAKGALAAAERFVLMRHDIDFDLQKALEIARIEEQAGVRSTYFFMLRTEHYNLLTRDGTAAVREILGLGHYLGLHFDCASYAPETTIDEFAGACRREAGILESWFSQPVQVVSYHRPASNVLMGNAKLSEPYLNTYLPLFTKQIQYCSDSRGQWKYGTPTQTAAFANGEPLHILIHPIWWCRQQTEAVPVLNRLLEEKTEIFRGSFRENCSIFGK